MEEEEMEERVKEKIRNEENQYLIDYYANYDEDGRLGLRRGAFEYLTTMRYIEKYLKPGDRILEIGAATGRYSHNLARKGYNVDAVELLEHHIEIFRKNTQPDENVTITQGNALDLSAFHDNTYDITLLLGPLYHLYTQEDKRQAISESIRVTKHGGVIFAAYVISDSCILFEGFINGGINVAEFIEKGLIDPVTFETHSEPKDLFELVRKEHIDDLMSVFPVSRLHYVATGGCMRYVSRVSDAIDAMDDKTYELLLKFHFATCEREDLVGISSHTLDVFRKD